MPTRPITTPQLLKQLATVTNPPEPEKPKKPKKPKLKQKKRPSARQNRTRKRKETTNLAHITKAIITEGGTVPDVGVVLGCQQMEGGQEWLDALNAEGLSITEFMQAAKQRADIELIRAAVRAATGYEYEEESNESTPEYDKQGELTGKYLPGKKKVTRKRQSGDAGLLKFLLMSRMPDFFNDTRHIEINKRVVELKADAEAEIKGFAAGLLKAFGEPVDAEFVEPLESTQA
jgi:hypothetical protein